MTVCAGRASVPPAAPASSPADSLDRLWGVGKLTAPVWMPAGPGLVSWSGVDAGGLKLLLRCCSGCCCWLLAASAEALVLLLPVAAAGRLELPPLPAALLLPVLAPTPGLLLALPLAPPRCPELPAPRSPRAGAAAGAAAGCCDLPDGAAGQLTCLVVFVAAAAFVLVRSVSALCTPGPTACCRAAGLSCFLGLGRRTDSLFGCGAAGVILLPLLTFLQTGLACDHRSIDPGISRCVLHSALNHSS